MTEPADRIELRGLRVVAVHGLLPEERERAQPFEVDVDLEVDLRAAGRSDDLGDTVDYGAVASAVAAEVGGPPSDLLEHLAERVARAAVAAARSGGGPPVTAVTVTLRKLRPPVPQDLALAGVRIRRRAEELSGAAPRRGRVSRTVTPR